MRIIMQCTSDKILIKRLSNRNFIFFPYLSRTGDKKLALKGLTTSMRCKLYITGYSALIGRISKNVVNAGLVKKFTTVTKLRGSDKMDRYIFDDSKVV